MRPRTARPQRLFLALAALLLAAPARADTLRVPQDFATIQAAVDAAEGGDEILISKGVYVENVVVNEFAGGLTLRGKGKVVLRAPNSDGTALNLGLADRTRVEGLTLASADVGLSVGQCADVDLHDLRFEDIDGPAILISASQRVSVRDTRIDEAAVGVSATSATVIALHGLRLRDVTTGVLLDSNCLVTSVAECRMQGRGDGTGTGLRAAESALSLQVRDNRVSDFGTGVLVEGNSISVLDNTISRCTTGMILGSTGTTQLIQAVDNRLSKIDGIGVSLLGNLMLLRGNRVNKAGTGMYAHPNQFGALLHDNRVTGSAGVGLDLNGNSNALVGNVFKGSGSADVEDDGANNQFAREQPHEGGKLLRVPQDFATIQQALSAAENGVTVLVSAGTYVEALGLSNAEGVTLRGKGKVVVSNPDGTALALEDCEDILIDSLRFTDSDRGLRLTDCAGVTVLDCRFEDNAERGVDIDDGDALFVLDSRFDGNEEAVFVVDAGRSAIAGNRLRGQGADSKSFGVRATNITQLSVAGNRVWDAAVGVRGGDRNMSVGDNRVWNTGLGIDVASEGGLVHANRVTKTGRGVETDSDGAGDAQVAGNRVLGCSERGMVLGAPSAIIAGNLIKGSGSHGLQHFSVLRILVTANRVLGNALDGLETQAAQQSLYSANKAAKNKSLDMRVTDFDNNAFHGNALKTTNLDP